MVFCYLVKSFPPSHPWDSLASFRVTAGEIKVLAGAIESPDPCTDLPVYVQLGGITRDAAFGLLLAKFKPPATPSRKEVGLWKPAEERWEWAGGKVIRKRG